MFVEPTVLILGAGASLSYGYPLGTGLTRHILSPLQSVNFRDPSQRVEQSLRSSHRETIALLEMIDATFEDWRAFVISFHRSSFQTIDQFIGARSENKKVAEIGKVLIAQKLLQCEADWVNGSHVFDDTLPLKEQAERNVDFWYKTILHHLPHPNDINHNLSVVTFNYDLSLHHAIYEHATHAFGLSGRAASDYVANIKIISVYGTVGRLKWQDPEGRNYGEMPFPDQIVQAAQNIKTISEARELTTFEEAKAQIHNARFRFILGFGFHYDNCQRIGLQALKAGNDPVYSAEPTNASSCGMTVADRRSVQRNFEAVQFDQPEGFTTITNYLRNCEPFRIATDIKRQKDPRGSLFISS